MKRLRPELSRIVGSATETSARARSKANDSVSVRSRAWWRADGSPWQRTAAGLSRFLRHQAWTGTGAVRPGLRLGKEAAMPNYDVIVYHDLSSLVAMPNYDVIVYHDLSSLVASVRPGDPARELGDIFG